MSKKSKAVSEAARLMGAKGGKATSDKLTPEQRVAKAKKAIAARWAKAKKEKP